MAIPAERGLTSKNSPKFIVAATPMLLPLSVILTPKPAAVTPVNPEPSPTKLFAVMIPIVLTLPSVPTPLGPSTTGSVYAANATSVCDALVTNV